MDINEFKIEIYVPEEFCDTLRTGINEIGACHIGNYDNCTSITKVTGTWRPLDGADPYAGTVGEISRGHEVKMEIRCKAEFVKAAIEVIKKIHPYEEPVYNIIPLYNCFF